MPSKVAALRERLYLAGLYGTRVSVLVGNPVTYPFPPYLASLVVSETPDALEQAGERSLAQAVFHTLRPYGGVACAWGSLADRSRIEEIVQDEAFPGASVRQVGDFVLLARSGPLPGAADWSHAEADAASTGASADEFSARPWPCCGSMRRSGGTSIRGRTRFAWPGAVWCSSRRVCCGHRTCTRAASCGRSRCRSARSRCRPRPARRPLCATPTMGSLASLAPTTELVVVEDAIYLSEGTSCLVFDPATGEPTGHIDLPDRPRHALGEPPRLR